MAAVEAIDKEIEEQKKRLAELEQQKSDTFLKDFNDHILEWCSASAHLLEYLITISEDEKIKEEFEKALPKEVEMAISLSKGVTEKLCFPFHRGLRPAAKRAKEADTEKLLKAWEDFKNSDAEEDA